MVGSMKSMKRIWLAGMCLVSALALGAEEMDCGFDRWYVGGAGGMVLPQGGSRMRRLAGGCARFGYYFTPVLALDGEAALMEDQAALSVKALWHLQGAEWWGMMFGYERFDPFLTVGAKGWLDHAQAGPVFGAGALYYLTDSWALRADADVVVGVDSSVEAIFSLSAGVQYSF